MTLQMPPRINESVAQQVLATKEGLPLAVKVFPGNTSDLASASEIVEDLKTSHNLNKVTIAGDRGMFSIANIDKVHIVDPDYPYISALRSTQTRFLIEKGSIQLELFDELDTLTRNTCLIPGTDVTFSKTSIPTDIQRQAFELIGAKILR